MALGMPWWAQLLLAACGFIVALVVGVMRFALLQRLLVAVLRYVLRRSAPSGRNAQHQRPTHSVHRTARGERQHARPGRLVTVCR